MSPISARRYRYSLCQPRTTLPIVWSNLPLTQNQLLIQTETAHRETGRVVQFEPLADRARILFTIKFQLNTSEEIRIIEEEIPIANEGKI